MKRLMISLAMALSVSMMCSHMAAAAVSISVGEPGFYGRLDLGYAPSPQFIYERPIVVQAPPPGVVYQPLYLRVPPGHASNWRNYCHRYDACGRPVYFVQDRWYRDVYVPHYRDHYGRGGERHSRRD